MGLIGDFDGEIDCISERSDFCNLKDEGVGVAWEDFMLRKSVRKVDLVDNCDVMALLCSM